MDAMWYRYPLYEHTCDLNTDKQPDWSLAVQIVVFDMTLVVMLLGYLIIWWRFSKRRRQLRPTKMPEAERTDNSDLINRIYDDLHWRSNVNGRRGNGFTIITFLTISVTITWVPLLSYSLATLFTDTTDELWDSVGNLLFELQSVIDPILFVATLADVRAAFLRQITC